MSTTTANDVVKTTTKKKRGKWTFLGAFTILFVLAILTVLATHVVQTGSYSKLEYKGDTFSITEPSGKVDAMPATQETLGKLGVKIALRKFESGALTKLVSVPRTYKELRGHLAGVQDMTKSMVKGTVETINIIVFIPVLRGLIGVVRAAGAFESGLLASTKKTKGREFALIFAVSVFMMIGRTTCGLEEEAVAFYPILCPVFIALGYDSIICVGATFLTGSIGTMFSTINPSSSVIASNAAGIQFTDGIWWHAVGCLVGGVVVVLCLYWYTNEIKKNPRASLTYENRGKFSKQWTIDVGDSAGDLTWRGEITLILFVSVFVLMVYRVMQLGQWFPDTTMSFLAITVVIMFIVTAGKKRLKEKQLVDAFADGASNLVGVSLIIGLARGINTIMNEERISNTLLEGTPNLVQGVNGPMFTIMMMLIFFVLGFVVPSFSDLAVLVMPIMTPLEDSVRIERFIIVYAYQWGQYAMLFLAPIGLVMATLQMLDMKFPAQPRFVWPMVIFVLGFGRVILVTQVLVCSWDRRI